MSNERLDTIRRMLPGWEAMDSYEEDYAKTEVIEELILEIDQFRTGEQGNARE